MVQLHNPSADCTALRISLRRMIFEEVYGQKAKEIACVLAYLASIDVNEKDILAGVGEETSVDEAIRQLQKYSIVLKGRVRMDESVQQAMRSELQNCLREEETLCRLLNLLKKCLVDNEGAGRNMPHIISVWNYASNYDKLVEDFIVNRNDSGDRRTTYFHLIAGSHNYDLFKRILEKIKEPKKLQKIINARNEKKKTPLHYAAQGGSKEIVELLISKKANVETRDRLDNRPLHVAARNGHLGIVECLLRNKVAVNTVTSKRYQFTPLHFAARNGHLEIVIALLENGADINAKTKYQYTPLHFAVENGHLDIVKTLLKNNEINFEAENGHKMTPLHLAAEQGHLNLVRALLEKGANHKVLNNGCFTPLHLASLHGHINTVEALLANARKYEPTDASYTGINMQTTKGNTALHLAVEKNHINVVEFLMTKTAFGDIENEEGKTAQTLAAEMDNLELLDSIREQTEFGRRLGTSAINGQLYKVYFLVLCLLDVAEKNDILPTYIDEVATKASNVGNFDVAFKYNCESGKGKSKHIFALTKHRDDPKKDTITIDNLFSNSEKGEFNLKKYFNSFRKVLGQSDKTSEFDDVHFIIYTNATTEFSCNEPGIIKEVLESDNLLKFSEEDCHFLKFVRGKENRKWIDVLENSSKCKKLATALAEAIYLQKHIAVDEDILKDYHILLSKEVIQKCEGPTKGKLREDFLSNNCHSFRNAFFSEIRKRNEYAKMSDEELKSDLKSKIIKVADNFGKINAKSGNYPDSLPNDLVRESEIEYFLSRLSIFIDQPNETDLRSIFTQKMKRIYEMPDVTTLITIKTDIVLECWKKGEFTDIFYMLFQDSLRPIKFNMKNSKSFFIGRETEIVKLHDMLKNSGKAVITQCTSVPSLGGVGKSELAKKYICEYGKNYHNIIWINADNYWTTSAGLLRLAERLGISCKGKNSRFQDIKSVITKVYNFFNSDKKSIFIFYNAGKPEVYGESNKGIIELFLSGLKNLCTIITSSYQEWGEANALILDVFTEDEAVELIKKALDDCITLNENEIKRLAEEMQYLPLTLSQAIAYIKLKNDEKKKWKKIDYTVGKFLDEYYHKKALLKETRDTTQDHLITKIVQINWRTVIEQIKEFVHNDVIMRIINVAAFLASDNIPVKQMFDEKIEGIILERAFDLLNRSFVACIESGMLNIHTLVQEVTRMDLVDKNEDSNVIKETCDLLVARATSRKYSRELLPHIEVFHSHMEDFIARRPDVKEIKMHYLPRLLELK